jgi:calcium-dependent protein kinase
VDSIQNIRFSTGDFVQGKQGKINKDYTLLNPPLGKGAFGEVRKAIHKTT